MTEPVVSYVVTVYNKEPYIGYTLDSLLQQEGDVPREYIFVDDVSTDRSVAVIEEKTRGLANVTIIKNTVNAGPSIRLNQGARLARGKYLQFIDSDDIMAANATAAMFALAERYQADLVHGSWEKTGMPSAALIGRRIEAVNPRYVISDVPLNTVFKERIRRMSQMVLRETFLAAGGCDEKVFIQDESLGLRLARASKRIILLKEPVLLIPYVEGELSRNVSQLNHDRFLASYDMLQDFPDLKPDTRKQLYSRCVSSYWKETRHQKGVLAALATPAFLRYLGCRYRLPPVNIGELDAMYHYFSGLTNVRRVHG